MTTHTIRDERPWYRQLWPWLIIVPPLATIIGGLLTLALALRYPEYDVRDDHHRPDTVTLQLDHPEASLR